MLTGASDHDPLTGLGRIGTFQAEIDARSRSNDGQIFIAGVVDVEGLRHINRELGNAAGDSLLRSVAHRLTASGLAAVVTRIGSDEFGLIVDGVAPEKGGQWFRRVQLDALAQPFDLGGSTVTVQFRKTRRAGPLPAGRNLLWELQRDAFIDSTRELYQRAAAYEQALERMSVLVDENKKLLQMAMTDPLTGLLNRRGIYEELETVVQPTALAFVDLDDLRELNKLDERWDDGDAALCGLADRLREAFGEEIVGRLGGDEFLIVSTTESAQDTADLLKRILHQCRSELVISGRPITFSAGVSDCAIGIEAARTSAQDAVSEAKITKATIVLSASDPGVGGGTPTIPDWRISPWQGV
jgi:diguanylate cyclase (GGDEF)-like protein